MTATLHITRGIPASGKTTWAKNWVATDPTRRVRVNRDDIREMLFGVRVGLDHGQEKLVTTVSFDTVSSALKAGKSVVVDDMNLRPSYVRKWIGLCTSIGAAYKVVEFPTTLDDAIRRDKIREHSVGEEVIRTIASKFYQKGKFIPVTLKSDEESPEPDGSFTKYSPDTTKPKAVIVDVDGTIALMNGRDPYDWGRVSEDSPNSGVIEIVKALVSVGFTPVFLTGRKEAAYDDTLKWIRGHFDFTVAPTLIARDDDDDRPDSKVKYEMFDNHVRSNYNVVAVLDDRNSVVKMWREIGLTCMQVAEGNF